MTLAFGISLVACGDSGDTEPRNLCASDNALCAIGDFEEGVLREKLEGCAGDPNVRTCHINGTSQTTMELDLTDPGTSIEDAIGALINQAGAGGLYVDTSCSEDGDLLKKLTPNGGGNRMPLDGDFWSNDEIDCFRVYLRDTFEVPDAE